VFKLIYLPESEYIVDGSSTWGKPNAIQFISLYDAENYKARMYFKYISNPDWVVGEPKGVYYSSSSPDGFSKHRIIPKYLIEIIEVPDV
jgi:hypothetical protein